MSMRADGPVFRVLAVILLAVSQAGRTDPHSDTLHIARQEFYSNHDNLNPTRAYKSSSIRLEIFIKCLVLAGPVRALDIDQPRRQLLGSSSDDPQPPVSCEIAEQRTFPLVTPTQISGNQIVRFTSHSLQNAVLQFYSLLEFLLEFLTLRLLW